MKKLLSLIVLAELLACTADPSSVAPVAPNCGLSGPTVTPATATLHVGDTVRATVALTPCQGIPTPAVFLWRSSDTLRASVDSITGLVRARRSGGATIVASLVIEPAISGAMALLVIP